MAGYAQDFSKSNNAVDAERAGRFPASVLAKRIGVKCGAIKALLSPCEWHHTSKHYNATDYYSEESALEIIDELRAWREPEKDVAVFEHCRGSYLEWSGTRNHPHARAIEFANVRATKKGQWFTLDLTWRVPRSKRATRVRADAPYWL